jgi:hypothetical protein
MRINIDGVMVEAMAEILQPQLQSLTEKAMEAAVAKAKETSDDPLIHFTIDLAAGWVAEHGAEEAQALIKRLASALDDNDPARLHEDLSAEELTQLTDILQTAEARQKRRSAASLQRLGSVLGNIARYAGRAFVVAVVK